MERSNADSALLDEGRDRLKAGDFAKAEIVYRAHFVKYLEWVHEHTLPILDSKSPALNKIVEIDIEALLELADTVADCLNKLNRPHDAIKFLQHVEVVVPLPGFKKHAAYLQALWLYIGLNDKIGARRELQEIGDILAYDRREGLELYLDLFGDDLSERVKIEIAERIISQSETDAHVRIQYSAVKAISLVLIGERQQATTELQAALGVVAPPPQIRSFDELVTQWQLAKAWSLYGELNQDGGAFLRAEKLFLQIPEQLLTQEGKANLFHDIAWVLRDQERFRESAGQLRRSLSLLPSKAAEIHLAHCLALSGEVIEARTLLDNLAAQPVDPNLQLEYLAAKSSLAIATNDTGLARETVEGLRRITSKAPFWNAQRDELTIQILDFIHRPESSPPTVRQRTIVKLLLSVNEIVELKPKLFGIGFNINKMIEKLAKRLQKR